MITGTISFPYRSHWTLLVAQTVKNLLAVQETQVQSLGQEDPLEKEIGIHSSVLTTESWWATVGGSQRVRHD